MNICGEVVENPASIFVFLLTFEVYLDKYYTILLRVMGIYDSYAAVGASALKGFAGEFSGFINNRIRYSKVCYFDASTIVLTELVKEL